MKKLILLSAILFCLFTFGCKKGDAEKQVDKTPRFVQVTFTNNRAQSTTYFTLNDRTTSLIGINGSTAVSVQDVQVVIGDKLTAHMFTGATKPTNYSIKISFSDKQLAYSDVVVVGNQTHTVEVTHTFTEADFK